MGFREIVRETVDEVLLSDTLEFYDAEHVALAKLAEAQASEPNGSDGAGGVSQ